MAPIFGAITSTHLNMLQTGFQKSSKPTLKLPSIGLLFTTEQLQHYQPNPNPSTTDWLNALCKQDDKKDVELFCKAFPGLTNSFIPVSIIGEGTFSTVYKAIDVQHYRKQNQDWIDFSLQDEADVVRLWMLVEGLVNVDSNPSITSKKREQTKNTVNDGTCNSSGLLAILLRKYVIEEWLEKARQVVAAKSGNVDDETELAQAMLMHPPHFVAIKRINPTSAPSRILDELSYLQLLGGKSCVVPIIEGMRHEDQVLVMFPFFCAPDFRELLPGMTVREWAWYMRLLFESLGWIHQQGIIHRDIKPSNFLFSVGEGANGRCRALLVDFGLAQV